MICLLIKDCIDRAHRVGKSYIDKSNGKSVKSIIIKYKAWNDRRKFYLNRPKKKPGINFSVSVDLTKRRHTLLKKAREAISDDDYTGDALYAFSDINCSLGIKLSNGDFKFFNSEKQLDDIL